IRNAVDHGLERPDRRRAAGKPAVGVVTVSAREQRGTLVLEVADDGGGIDVDAMLHRAAEQGLVPPGQDAGPGFDLLFRPGFSTAARVTEVSGRGVGLDAVAAMARGLGGAVALRSEPGQGTTFTVTLPLTLAAIRSLLLRAGGRTLALPLAAVGRVERAGARPVAAELAAVLGLNGTGVPAPPARLAVLSLGDDPTAVLVDEIRGEEEIVVANLPLPLRRVRFTAGATILGTGEVVPVLHAAEVFRAAATPVHRPVVVVADDSPAVRAATQAALESAGYEVRPAADGGEALALVEAGGCDAVVSDVQMPGLDGHELCRRLRADRRFRTLPVLLVTSLAAPDDRRRGLDAGADAYLVKGHSDPTVLLTTLRGLL
ncbi:MAG TPA: response regulator, partial [Acidimicrobiia bacterium]|nr:response regulator [Acidimicrobiia bacterium]